MLRTVSAFQRLMWTMAIVDSLHGLANGLILSPCVCSRPSVVTTGAGHIIRKLSLCLGSPCAQTCQLSRILALTDYVSMGLTSLCAPDKLERGGPIHASLSATAPVNQYRNSCHKLAGSTYTYNIASFPAHLWWQMEVHRLGTGWVQAGYTLTYTLLCSK